MFSELNNVRYFFTKILTNRFTKLFYVNADYISNLLIIIYQKNRLNIKGIALVTVLKESNVTKKMQQSNQFCV